MPVTIGQLCADERLRLRVLAGRGSLHQGITWAHTSELLDPTPWLQGGELLMTLGLALTDDEAEQRAYVGRLAQSGLAGLAFDTGIVHDRVPPAVVDEARAADFPLLAIPADTPFIAISRAVISRLNADEVAAVGLVARRQERVAAGALDDGAAGAVHALARALSATVVLVDADGRVLHGAGPDQRSVRSRAASRIASVGGPRRHGPVSFTHADDVGYLTVQSLSTAPLSPVYLVLGSAHPFSSHERLVIGHAVTVLALVERRTTTVLEVEARLRRRVLTALLTQRSQADVGLVRAFGFSTTEQVGLAVLEGAGSAHHVVDAAERCLLEEGVPFLAAGVERGVVVMLPATGCQERAVSLQGRLEDELGTHLALGISAPVPVVGAGEGMSQALAAARAAAGQPSRRLHYADLGTVDLLLRSQPREVLQMLASSVTEPITTLDRGVAGDLLQALETFLAHTGHWESAAAALGIHRHTLRKRIERAGAALGRDLGSTDGRAEVWLALRARDHLATGPADDEPASERRGPADGAG